MLFNTKDLISLTEANQNFSKVARTVDEKGSPHHFINRLVLCFQLKKTYFRSGDTYSCGDIEPGAVSRAGHYFPLKLASGQVSAHVAAPSVYGVVIPIIINNQYFLTLDN